MKTLLGILLLFCSLPVFAQAPWTNILAPNRATDWTQAGISGGIPSGAWTQCGSTIAAYGSSGSPASPSTIISAITACSGTNEYVLLGPGTFYLNAAIRNVGVHNVELRGSGPQSTTLHFTNGSTCQAGNGSCLVGFESSDGTYAAGVGSNFYSWTAGYSQNATSITISSGTNIVANSTMLMLDQCDTGYSGSPCVGSAVDNGNFFEASDAYNPSGPTGNSFNGFGNVGQRAHRGQIEMVQVTSCSPACGSSGSTTVTITPGLHHANWASGQTPQVWLVQPSQYVGVRNLTIDGSATSYSSTTAGLSFNNAANDWVVNVILKSLPNISLYIIQNLHGDFESNYIYNSGQSSASTDNSGINWYGSDNLITNNICQNCHLAIIAGTGNSGNVISYNYLINGYTGNGTLFGDLWPGHSNGADYNLYEGNASHMYDTDQTHGGQMMNTLYRNFLTGWESCSNGNCGALPASKMADITPVMILSYQRYHNIIGNVLGTPGITTAGYQYVNNEYFFSNPTGYSYNWTSGNQCSPPSCSGGPIPIEPITGTTSMRWGNWDAFNGATRWITSEVPSGISVYPNPVPTAFTSSVSGPPSLYLSSRPAWYSSSIPFPAIGPDVTSGNVGQCGGTPNTAGQYALVAATNPNQCAGQGLNTAWAGHVNAIPAMSYYYALGGLPDGTGPILPFDGTSYYSGTPQASGPTYSPVSGTYSSTQSVSLSTATAGATMCYTTDGSTPTATTPGTCLHGTTYSGAISVSSSETITALATESGYTNSPVTSASYVIGNPTLAAPTFNKAGGAYLVLPTVTITVPAGSTGCYTTDGSTPLAATPGTCSHGTTYSTPVTIGSTNTTLKAIATETSFVNSSVTSATYTQSNIVLDTSSTFNGGNVNLTAGSCPAITPTAGDGMVVEVEFGTFATFVSVTDNVNSGSYTAAIPVHYNSTIQQYVGVYYKSSVGANPTTITLTMSGPNNFVALACQAWKPLVPGIFAQDTAFTQQQDVLTTANPNTGSTVSPTNNNELVIGSLLSESQLPSSAGSGYTLLAVLPGAGLSSEYQVQSTSTATNAPWVMVSDSWTAQQSAFFFTPPPSNLNVSISGSVKFVGSVGVQ